MKCKNCKWRVDGAETDDRLKTCEQPKAKVGYNVVRANIPDDGLHIENDEGWGWLMGPDFGCVNWEKK